MLAVGCSSRLDSCDSMTATNDEEALAAPLDGVEEFGETTSSICRRKPSHKIRLSDYAAVDPSERWRNDARVLCAPPSPPTQHPLRDTVFPAAPSRP